MTLGTYTVSIFISVLQIVMLAVLLTLSIRMIDKGVRSLAAVNLSFCLALWLLGDLYWIVYDLMRPESRMPFAANEIGEAAVFLMLAAVINSVMTLASHPSIAYTIGAIIFGIGNTALWIAWSGEWIQDILIGAVFTWLLYSIVRSLVNLRVLPGWQWILLGILCIGLIAGQSLLFFVENIAGTVIETGVYVILFVGIIIILHRLILSYKEKDEPRVLLTVAFAMIVWIVLGKYMSEGTAYNVFLLFETICLPLCFLAVRRVVTGE